MHFDQLKRREFIALVGAAGIGLPFEVGAQQAGKVWRIGFLSAQSRAAFSELYTGFQQGMRELGYVEGKDFVGEFRFAEGQYARLPDLAAELVALNVDILFTAVTAAIRPLQQATRTIPIVFTSINDPVGNGFVASLAQPGGNTTGLAGSTDDTAPKQLDLLAAIVPNVSRVGLLGNPDNPSYAPILTNTRAAARQAGLTLVPAEARNLKEIERAFGAFGQERVRAFMMAPDSVFFSHRQQLLEFALRDRLPSMFGQREYAAAGGLMSYGESVKEFYRRAATYVDKIFKGAKPANLPVEQPTRFHLVINRKTAQALGVTIPPHLYIFADEVLE
jgi:putative ABC transport system substrate-binding protein